MLTGAAGLVIGGDVAFRWSLYLLLSLWPVAVYVVRRGCSACAVPQPPRRPRSPFLVSAIGVGYEPKAYVWIGYGVWAQLWASWTLPLAWAFTWRAMSSTGAGSPAVVFVALTDGPALRDRLSAPLLAIFSFLAPWRGRPIATGAPPRGGVPVAPCSRRLGDRAAHRPGPVGGDQRDPRPDTALVNGYGAKQVLAWLVTGHLFDAGGSRSSPCSPASGLGLACSAAGERSPGRAPSWPCSP